MRKDNKKYKYKAFISYSHKDEKFAKWLHSSLEKYKIPKELRETYKDLPNKLYPIFRDREELPTSSNLSKNITEALRDSKYLIVICSVDSAKSFWVNQEIIDFKTMHGEDRILAIILNGEPNAKDSDKYDDELECFPEAIKYKIKDGKLTNERIEPIAADVREGKDGKEFGKLKLIAGLLGVGFEELYRREEKRERQRRAFLVGALGGVSGLAGVSIWKWIEADENKQKALLELEKANHNIGLALVEKAKVAAEKQEIAKAHLLAFSAFSKINEKYDITKAKANAESIIMNYKNRAISTIKEGNGSKSVAYSPDGKTIIFDSDNTIEIWDVKNFKNIATLKGHKNVIQSVAYSPDGNTIISASWDETVKIWDAHSFKEIATLKGHKGYVFSVIYSPDSKIIISGSGDNTIKVWDAKSFKEITTMEGNNPILSLAYSPNEKTIALGYGIFITILDAKSFKEIATLKGHKSFVFSVAYSPDGKTIISGSWDNTIKVWDAKKYEEISTLKGHKAEISSVDYSPDGKYIISGSRDGTIKVWDARNYEEISILKGAKSWVNSINNSPAGWVNSVAYSPDGRTIISGSMDSIKIWDTESFRKNNTFKVKGMVSWVAIDGKTIIASIKDTIKMWDAKSFKEITTIIGKNFNRPKVYSPDGKTFISCFGNNIKVVDTKTLKEIAILKGHKNSVHSVDYSPDGKRIISGSQDYTIKIWDTKNFKEIATIKGYKYGVFSVVYSPDGKYIISGSGEQTIKIWDAKSFKEVATLRGHKAVVHSVACSPDGKIIVSGSWDKTVRIWDMQKLTSLDNPSYINQNIKKLEQFLQAKLDGITLKDATTPPLSTKESYPKHHPFHWIDDAESGDAEAMYQLGLIYDRDNENQKAIEWYKKASAKGHKEAKEQLEFLQEWMEKHKAAILEKGD